MPKRPGKATTKPRGAKDPNKELRDAVLKMAEEIQEACDEDQEWTSWNGNGTNAFEAMNIIGPLKELALKCR